MTEAKFKEMIPYNELSFGYRDKEYSIGHPGEIFFVWSEDQPGDADLEFASVDDLLDRWVIQGEPLREILLDIDLG